MKRFFTCLVLLISYLSIKAQIFAQNFSSSSTVSTYVSASTPNSGQFNAISSSGAGTVVSITNGKLQFSQTANAGSFSRTTDFSPTPTLIKYAFKLSVSGNSTATTNVGVFQIGSAFGTANSSESNANTHSRLGVNFSATNGTFTLRDIGTSTNSTSLSGEQQISWYVNNTGSTITYVNPNNGATSLANDAAHVWAGTNQVLSINAQTASQTLTDLKFTMTNGNGTIMIDDIVITSGSEVLNIDLSSFYVKKGIEKNILGWSTVLETNNAYFDIQNSTDAKIFQTIGQVKGSGTTNEKQNYSFEHQNPSVGINYYRLRSVDFDGKESLSNIVSVLSSKSGKVQVYPNPVTDKMIISTESNDMETFSIVNLLGQNVQTGQLNGQKEVNVNELSAGTYFLKVGAETIKFVKR